MVQLFAARRRGHRAYARVGMTYTCNHSDSKRPAGAPPVATHALRSASAVLTSLDQQPPLSAFLLPGIVSKCCSLLLPRTAAARVNASTQAAALDLMGSAIGCALDPTSLSADTLRNAAGTSEPHAQQAHAVSAIDVLVELRDASRGGERCYHVRSNCTPEAKFAAPTDQADRSSFRVQRDAAWLSDTCSSLHGVLPQVLSTLCVHSSPRVRAALSRALCGLLSQTASALTEALRSQMLQALLFLSCDTAPSVNKPCALLFERTAGRAAPLEPGAQALLEATLAHMLPQLQSSFQDALLRPAADAAAAAKRLAACLHAMPPEQAVATAVLPAAALQSFLASVTQYLQVDGSLAALWLEGHSAHGLLQARVGTLATPPGADGAAEEGANRESGAGAGSQRLPAQPKLQQAAATPFLAGAMPLALRYVSTAEVFAAVARVPQALGCACAVVHASAENGGAAVAVVDMWRRSMEEEAAGPHRRVFTQHHGEYRRVACPMLLVCLSMGCDDGQDVAWQNARQCTVAIAGRHAGTFGVLQTMLQRSQGRPS